MARGKSSKKSKGETPAKDETKSTTKIESFKRDLKVSLKPEEIAERADRAAKLLEDRDHEESEFKAHGTHVRGRIAQMESEMRHLSGEVRTKCTYREVDCERRFIYETGVVQEVRIDTGEVISERPMTDREKQRDLPFDGGGNIDDEFGDEPQDDAA